MNTIVRWFTRNHVAANLLMGFIVVVGSMSLHGMKREIFPEFSMDRIQITVAYPGASPAEIEEGILVKIEEQIQGLEGIREITSRATEGSASVTVELERGTQLDDLMARMRNEIDRIETFPDDAEEPVLVELTRRRAVINIALHGDVPEKTLTVLAEKVQDDLLATGRVTQVEVAGVREYEISIEVPESQLRRHGLTLGAVATAVRRNSMDLPAGSVKSATGEVVVRTKGQRYVGRDFADILVVSRTDGASIRLGDIAHIHDTFEDVDIETRFDGHRATMVQVYTIGEQDVTDVARIVKALVEDLAAILPPGVAVSTWSDATMLLESRMDLLLRNARIGLALVVLTLALFLDVRLAFWICAGIPISFLGAFWTLDVLGQSINMMSLFALILVLGIVVDDAIIVGENVFSRREDGLDPDEASVRGTTQVGVPVVFSMLTTVAAFAPLLFVTGLMGKFMSIVPIVVISVLIFSLVESILILPPHLANLGMKYQPTGALNPLVWIERVRSTVDAALRAFIQAVYRPVLRVTFENRHVTFAAGVFLTLVTVGLVVGGRIQFNVFPKVDSDNLLARVELSAGAGAAQTRRAILQLEAAARKLRDEFDATRFDGRTVVFHTFSAIGATVAVAGGGPDDGGKTGSNAGQVILELLDSERRNVPSSTLASRWRELTGPIPGAVALTFSSSLFTPAGKPVEIRLLGQDYGELERAAAELKAEVARYPGVYDAADSFREGKLEMKLDLDPRARSLGLDLNDLASQVRQGFYGEEADRIQRGRHDVKVMVRYPRRERQGLGDVHAMRIRTPAGAEVPFGDVAKVSLEPGYASISRVKRHRMVSVTADVDEQVANAREIMTEVKRELIPPLLARYPGIRVDYEGQERETLESMESLGRGFLLALIAIYVLLGLSFGSYVQPLIIMGVIPFGIIGAVWGHVAMGLPLTILSIFGIVALSGVVVNDSLVMVDFVNRARSAGMSFEDALLRAGTERFRPILLTSLTTIAGLAPMVFETSVQAQFLIPMAVSLSFGLLFATVVTLILVPSLYALIEDLRGGWDRVWSP